MTERDVRGTLGKPVVLAVAEWREVGVTPARLRVLVRAGDLVLLRRGVYATRKAVDGAGGDPRRVHALKVAAVRAAVGEDAIASHHSAGRILGLDMMDPPTADTVTLTRPPPARSRSRTVAGVLFHNAPIPDWQRVGAFGVSLTNASRTVIDIARTSSFRAGVVVADCALRLDLTSPPELGEIARTCRQWPGIEQARRVIRFSDGNAESVLESCARVAFAQQRLEEPELQVTIPVKGDAFRVDFFWRKHQTIAEADGLGKYARPEDLKKQFARDRKLRAAGYRVVHFTWGEISGTPEYVVTQIREAFAAISSH